MTLVQTQHPAPSEKDIQFILGEVKNYLSPDLEGTPSSLPLMTSHDL